VFYKKASRRRTHPIYRGYGNPIIRLGEGSDINNASSTKQTLDNTKTELLVLAEDQISSFYVHNVFGLQGVPPVVDEHWQRSGVRVMIPFLFTP
jgi:hypothetical protein